MQAVEIKNAVTKQGAFNRPDSIHRNWVKADGSTDFQPEAGRYHLYVSYACPWASRCLFVRSVKGLEHAISFNAVAAPFEKTVEDPNDSHRGWVFVDESVDKDCSPDPIHGFRTVRQIYDHCGDEAGRYTVPILFDIKTDRIVSNESADIIQMLNSEFNEFAKNPELNLRPDDLLPAIEEVNQWVYPTINNGVYRCGFAQAQAPYDEAVTQLFESLDKVEEILKTQRYLTSPDRVTEADVRLFVTLVRFDEVYVGHFKCNKKRIADYHNIEMYVRDIYQLPGVAATVNMRHIRDHYHKSHKTINVFGIVPVGPGVDYSLPHDRDSLGPSDPSIKALE